MSKNDFLCIELKEESINFDSGLSPKAKFILILHHNKSSEICENVSAFVEYSAIVKNNILVQKYQLEIELDESGNFEFEIPKFTIALEVKIRLFKYDLCAIGYYPANCKYDFTAKDITTRLTIKLCNQISIDTCGLDHTPISNDEDREFGHQLGPHRSSRAMAIVHIAMFEAYISIKGGFNSYLGLPKFSEKYISVEAAIFQGMYSTLVAMYPSHKQRLTNILSRLLEEIYKIGYNYIYIVKGMIIGALSAKTILELRQHDGSDHKEQILDIDYKTSKGFGKWKQDPISKLDVALGSKWYRVKPFVIRSSSYYRIDPPPSFKSKEYMMAYNEVKSLGGDDITTPTVRSEEATNIGIFWAYDGTPSLCAPPRLYNQLLMNITSEQGTDTDQLLYLLTLLNVALADAGIASWESKYYYNFCRPVTAIREAMNATKPCYKNPGVIGDTKYTPHGAPSSNVSNGVNFTPPFPSYPSGHATFGGVVFQLLRKFYKNDNIKFTFVSDEYNGITKDINGNIRPLLPRTFNSFSQAEEENGQSRIYLGIHWSFDKTNGIKMGNKIADYIFDNLYVPK